MKRLFGTDGIRSVAGEYPLDRPTVRRIGAALASVLGNGAGSTRRVVLGRDTRESGPWLRDALAAGLERGGAVALDAGVISTPGLAYVLQSEGFDAGVMISASHNPFADNGLKAFGADGTKLPDSLERHIEELVLDREVDAVEADAGTVSRDEGLRRHYIEHLEGVLAPGRFRGMHVVLDCANGSASAIAPDVFRHYGAEVTCLGDAPDGRNINLGCGSTHLAALTAAMAERGANVGLAFDGDADRCLAVDRHGRVVDGDHILYITARGLKRNGKLPGDALVATIMSNFWLEELLSHEGIALHRAPVGDKYVLERMVDEGLVLGGEQSGHVIFSDLATTGDGILTGLLLLDTLMDEPQPLERILDGITPYPQLLINVRVREKPDLASHPRIGPVVAGVESALAGRGRVVLRYSGTEPLARVMLEGKDDRLVREQAELLAEAIRRELGTD